MGGTLDRQAARDGALPIHWRFDLARYPKRKEGGVMAFDPVPAAFAIGGTVVKYRLRLTQDFHIMVTRLTL